MRSADVCMLCFSITDRKSFEDLSAVADELLRVKDEETFPMVRSAFSLAYSFHANGRISIVERSLSDASQISMTNAKSPTNRPSTLHALFKLHTF
jgi:hypothetical protein